MDLSVSARAALIMCIAKAFNSIVQSSLAKAPVKTSESSYTLSWSVKTTNLDCPILAERTEISS